MPTLREQRVGLVARTAVRAAAPDAEDAAGVREQRELHVLAHRQRGEGLGDLEGAADAAGARSRAASGRPARGRPAAPSRRRARAGRSTMLKQVVLPAPFGPISASISPAARAKLTSSTARTPPNAFAVLRPQAAARHAVAPRDRGLAQRGAARFRPPAMPSGKTQHQRQHRRRRAARASSRSGAPPCPAAR